jgi:hypothetical protein
MHLAREPIYYVHTAQGSRDKAAGGTLTRLLPGQTTDHVFIPGEEKRYFSFPQIGQTGFEVRASF